MSSLKADTRLFSNLTLEGNRLNHQPGSVLGCTALVAGTTVGAGILALPSVTVASGVVPSSLMLIGMWLYTLVSGLLLAEISVNILQRSGKMKAGIVTMVEETLGTWGGKIAGGTYLFLHYALLVAYISQGGNILSQAASAIFPQTLPQWFGCLTFVLLFGSLLYFGRPKFVERFNNIVVAIAIAAFIGLLWVGATQIDTAYLQFQDWNQLPGAIPVMLVALFYHNIIPVLTTRLEGDIAKIRHSIVVGSLVPLLMFLAWNAAILGSTNLEIVRQMRESTASFDPLDILRLGGNGRGLGLIVSIFSELAIVTSFIGFFYGLLDFFQDILPSSFQKSERDLPLYSLILLPALSLSTLNPNLFFVALDYTGTFSISILGGILPSIVAWKIRDRSTPPEPEIRSLGLIGGGNILLATMIGIACAIVGEHLAKIAFF